MRPASTMRSALLVSILAGGSALAAAAQDWTGPAGVGVEVRDEGGQPIAGAAVVLVPGATAGAEAPPFVFTDASGRVEVRNLAEGEWQVEVRAAGYMIFNGYLKLAGTTAPEVGFSSRQRTGTFWQPLQVRFFVPGSPGDAMMVASTKEERRGEKKRIEEREELEKQEKRAQERAEARDRRRTQPTGGAEVARLREPTPTAPPAEPAAPEAEAPARVAEAAPPADAPETSRAPAPPPAVAERAREAAPPEPAAERPASPPPVAEPPPVKEPAARAAEAAPPPSPPPTQPAQAPAPAPPPAPPTQRPRAPAPAPPPTETADRTEDAEEPADTQAEPRIADVARPAPDAPRPDAPARPAAPARDTSPPTPPTRDASPPAPPAPAPAAPPAPPPAPAPPAPPPRAIPSIQARPVLFTGGACPECKPGEWALIVERRAAPATGAAEEASTCGSARDAVARRLANEVLAPAGALVAAFAGPVADAWGNGLPPAAREAVPADLAQALEPRDGSCQDAIGVLPQGARFIGFRFEAEDAGGKGDCFGEDPCAIGQARWTSNPRIERTSTVTVIHSSFRNESTSTERRGRMTLYFQPPRGWQPPG